MMGNHLSSPHFKSVVLLTFDGQTFNGNDNYYSVIWPVCLYFHNNLVIDNPCAYYYKM